MDTAIERDAKIAMFYERRGDLQVELINYKVFLNIQ